MAETPTEIKISVPVRIRTKIGVVFTPLNNFKGCIEAMDSMKSKHDLETYIMPQYRHKVALSAAWNEGIHRAVERGCDYILICNDDILFAPHSIDAMVVQYEKLRHTENVIMVTPNNIKLELADPYDILNYQPHPDAPTYSEHPNFSCFLIAPEFVGLVGSFDENFWPAWYEDNDMHRRIDLLGYKAICTTAAPQVHFGGVSTSLMTVEERDSGGSQRYYVEKWGGIPWPAGEIYKTPYNDPNLTPKDWIKR